MNRPETVTLAWTGASGMPYGLRLLQCLLAAKVRVFLLYSTAAQIVAKQELDLTLPTQPAAAAALFAEPQHPYTIGLLGSIPQLHLQQQRLIAIAGQVPDPMAPVAGCSFHPRCPFAVERCSKDEPPLEEVKGAGGGHEAACWEAPLDVKVLQAA